VPDYRLEWRIDLTADNPEDAAREAWRLMRIPDSTANVFHVFDETGQDTQIDLTEIDEERETVS
jgi:hypothetical protein